LPFWNAVRGRRATSLQLAEVAMLPAYSAAAVPTGEESLDRRAGAKNGAMWHSCRTEMGSPNTCWEVLPGLPPYGDPAQPFSSSGMGKHSEGLVVRFRQADGSTWTGNFQGGVGQAETVVSHPNGREVIVIAAGTAYIVDASARRLLRHFGGDIEFAERPPDSSSLIFGNGLWFECLTSEGPGWRTRRISWDGMRNIAFIGGDQLIGEACDLDDGWHPFSVDLRNGEVTGGSYEGPDLRDD
jgi:hypothetical protein